MHTADEDTRLVRLFVRPNAGGLGDQATRTAVDTLQSMADSGDIDAVEVYAWGRSFVSDGPLVGTRYHDRVRRHLDAVEEWTDRTGEGPAPAFRRRTVTSTILDHTHEEQSLPVVSLALYIGDELRLLAPTAERSVDDALSTLEGLDHQRPPSRLLRSGHTA